MNYVTVTGQDVTDWAGHNNETPPSGEDYTTKANRIVPKVTAMVKAYTRGRGFQADGTMAEEIAAVVASVTSRVIANPEGLQNSTGVDDATRSISGWKGFNILETLVLDRYRVKAQ